MKLTEWQSKVRTQLQQSTHWLRQATPGMAYGALATCTLLPLVPLVMSQPQPTTAAAQVIGNIFGGIGLNLVTQQLLAWFGKSDEDLAKLLGQKAAAEPEWRKAFDELIKEFETPKLTQAVLSEADWDRFAQLLRQDVRENGSSLVISGDFVAGDKVDGDKIGGDQVAGHKAGRDLLNAERDFYYVDQRTTTPTPSPHSNHYFHRLRTHCHAMPLTAMGGEASAGEEVTLDKVYIALDTTTRRPLTTEEKAALKKANPQRTIRDDAERAITALEAAQQEQRLVLLGHPGGGKSTFVRQLLAETATRWLEAGTGVGQEQPAPFPLLTVLRDLTPRLQALALDGLPPSKQEALLRDALLAQWHADLDNFGGAEHQATLEQALLSGALLLVFDGLDEMPAAVRPLVRAALVALTKAYGQIGQIIVTCRIRSYHGAAVLPGFQAYTLADFDETKIKTFVAGWYAAQQRLGRLTPERAKAQREDLQHAALQRDLRRMAVNPLLLTTMAIIHQKQTRLPDQRVQLYDEAVDVLLNRWQQERANFNSPELTAFLKGTKVRPLLERLAYAAHQPLKQATTRRGAPTATDESADLTRSDVLALLDEALQGQMGLAAEFLDYVDLRAGLLVGRGGEESSGRPALYAFAHRTFQEYLAGCWLLTGRERKRNFWAHAAEGDYWQLAAQLGAEELLYNRRDEQGLLDLMYHLCPVRAPRNKQARRANLWSGQMAALLERQTIESDSFADGGVAYLERLRKRLLAILTGQSTLPALERAEAGRVLAKLGDPRAEVMTLDAMEFCFIPAGPFVMGSKQGEGPGEDPLAFGDEEPQHTYDIKHDYWLARYPLTNAQYAQFVDDNGYTNPAYWTEAAAHGYWENGQFRDRNQPAAYGDPFHFPNHPVVGISWYEALAYTRWLTAQLPQGWQVRLPSEAEWEKGARGGKQIPQAAVIRSLNEVTEAEPVEAGVGTSGNATGAGAAAASTSSASALYPASVILIDNPNPIRRYAWGDQIDPEKLNYNETNIGSTSAVGAFPGGASPYGVEEMNGNVLEWCSTQWLDDYTDYQQKATDAPDADAWRVVRGGSFADLVSGARATYRYGHSPVYRDHDVGVRLVRSPSPLVSVPLSSEI